MTNPKPSRKRWTIGLAVVVLFAAVAWLVAFPAYKRHRAIQEIERVGGTVWKETVGPKWLQKLGFGFDRVYVVRLNTAAHLDTFGRFDNDRNVLTSWML